MSASPQTVEEFKADWVKFGCPILPPFERPIHITDMAYSLCLYRRGRFQVELYICKPNTQTQIHSHPGIEHLSVYLAGNLEFSRGDSDFMDLSQYQKEGDQGTHMLFGKCVEAINGTEHSLKVGSEGGSFLIFEKWKDADPSSVAVVYDGPLLGEKHAQTIREAA